ncbi:hypothetical protein Csa_008042 [Cucumis sativus]|nr:hypothetical protein Csa_008042 [Cucumis sativus]
MDLFFFFLSYASVVQWVWTGRDSSLLDAVARINVAGGWFVNDVGIGGVRMLSWLIRVAVAEKGGEVYLAG